MGGVAGKQASWWYEHSDGVAKCVAATVLLVGLAFVGVAALPHFGELTENPFTAPEETNTVVHKDAAGNVTSTDITTGPADRSLPERALGPGALLFVRLALVGLGAFLAAAFTQKLLAGDYAIKVGGLELRQQITADATQSVKDLELLVAKLQAEHDELNKDADRRFDVASRITSDLTTALAQVTQRVEEIGAKLAPITARRPPR